jgi:hypothetical protein
MGPPHQDGHLGPLFDQWIGRPANVDSIDIAITYRFPNAGEGSGGNADHIWKTLHFSVIVWGAPLTNVFCQESCHNFGLEPPQDPHLDPAHGPHSKDVNVDPNDAELGFDPHYNEVWPNPTHDLMYFEGPDPGFPDSSITLNDWDWEYLRQQIAKLPSTGPTGPFIWFQSLGGPPTLLPSPVAGANADASQEVFCLGVDRAIYSRREFVPGGTWGEWTSLGGHDLRPPIRLINTADGRQQLFVLGGDQMIYYRVQTAPNGGWVDWQRLGGIGVEDFAVNINVDGRLELVAVWSDGTLRSAAQIAPNGAWNEWTSLEGHDLKGNVALGKNADGRLEAFVVGGDGVPYYRSQLGPNGQGGWEDWRNLASPTLSAVAELSVVSGADGRLFVFLMRSDKSLAYRAQAGPNGAYSPLVSLGGHDLRWPCTVGRNPDGRLEVFVIGGDQQIYNRWQTDPAKPDTWSDWVALGGRQLQTGIGLGADVAGELDIFVIGGDAELYRGPRTLARVAFSQVGPSHASGFAIDRPSAMIDIHASDPQLGTAAP